MDKHKALTPKPAQGNSWGILNPYGDFWTHNTFQSEGEARQYLNGFWSANKNAPDLSKYKIISVFVTVSALSSPLGEE